MNKELETKLFNVLKAEFDYIKKHEENGDKRVERMLDILHLEKIIENFDELEPVLQKYFAEKAKKEKFER